MSSPIKPLIIGLGIGIAAAVGNAAITVLGAKLGFGASGTDINQDASILGIGKSIVDQYQNSESDHEFRDLDDLQSTFTSTYNIVNSGIVSIYDNTEGDYDTGVIYKKTGNTYYVLTTTSAFDTATKAHDYKIVARDPADGELYETSATARNDNQYIAVYTFTSTQNYHVFNLSDASNIPVTGKHDVGDFVMTIGTPINTNYFNTMSTGIVSGIKDLEITEFGSGTQKYIQHDMDVNSGMFGSAIINENGHIVGLNIISKHSTPSGVPISGMTYGIHVSYLKVNVSGLE